MQNPLTLEEAKSLTVGQVIYHRFLRNGDKTPQRWTVKGKVKTWKRDPSRVQVPLKHGLYRYGKLTEWDLERFSLSDT